METQIVYATMKIARDRLRSIGKGRISGRALEIVTDRVNDLIKIGKITTRVELDHAFQLIFKILDDRALKNNRKLITEDDVGDDADFSLMIEPVH